MMRGTPKQVQDWVRGYYAVSTELYVAHWSGSSHALHLGLDDGTSSRNDALLASNAYLAQRASVGTGTRVLDAGCGIGGSSVWLARERGAIVTGITIAPEQVSIARNLAEEAGVSDRVVFHEMDFAGTSLPHGSFDVVWNIESLCHAFDKRAYLGHVRELLAAGGRWVCLDMFSVPGADPAAIAAMCDNWSMYSLPSLDEVRGWLGECGFVGVETADLTDRVRRPLEAIEAMGANAERMFQLEKALGGKGSPGHEAHVRGGLGCARGVRSGAFVYGYIGARVEPAATP